MTWFAVAGAAVTVVGGALSDKNANKQSAKQTWASREDMHEDHRLGMQRAVFDRQLDEHYVQKERAQRQRGLDEFRKFTTLPQFAPEYQDTAERVVIPQAPVVSDTPAWGK